MLSSGISKNTGRGAMPNFKAGGAITADNECYITRHADEMVARNVRTRSFTHLLEPRQQGKSSLINRLKDPIHGVGSVIIDIKADNYKPSESENWYFLIGKEILRQVQGHPDLLPRDSGIKVPRSGNAWCGFLVDLALKVTRETVVAIDEVDVIRFDGSDQFYSAIKNVSDLEQRKLSFLLSGCLHPHDLIQDRAVSHFDTGNRVELEDFDQKRVRELVEKGDWPVEHRDRLAARIFYWTDGHPYITQWLCHSLSPAACSDKEVDAAVDTWIRHDSSNLPRIVSALQMAPDLGEELRQLLGGKRIMLYSRDARAPHNRLRLLGVIKEDQQGFCIIRNRIYKRVFRRPGD
jgi:hypothetical protein